MGICCKKSGLKNEADAFSVEAFAVWVEARAV